MNPLIEKILEVYPESSLVRTELNLQHPNLTSGANRIWFSYVNRNRLIDSVWHEIRANDLLVSPEALERHTGCNIAAWLSTMRYCAQWQHIPHEKMVGEHYAGLLNGLCESLDSCEGL